MAEAEIEVARGDDLRLAVEQMEDRLTLMREEKERDALMIEYARLMQQHGKEDSIF